jgi:hypothetical protein
VNPRRGASVALALACLVVSIGPASAERASVQDRVGDDNGWGDIALVEVDHGARQLRVVIHQPPEASVPDQFEVWVDTTPRRHGADFVLLDYHGVWGAKETIHRVDRWRDDSWGRKVACRGADMDRVRDRAGDGHLMMIFTVPRRCLGNPAKLRIQAVTAQEHIPANDYAPGKLKPTRWLSAG